MGRNRHHTVIPVLIGFLTALLSAIIFIAYGTPSATSAPQAPRVDMATAGASRPTPEPTSITRAILGVEPEAEQTTWMMFVPMARMADALRALDPLLGAPQLGAADWTTQVLLQVDTIHTADRHLWDLEFLLLENEFYHRTLDATGWCNRAADHLEVAIADVRHDELRRAHTLLQYCRAHLKELASSRLTAGK